MPEINTRSPWWKKYTAAMAQVSFSPEEMIVYAQSKVPFDHRRGYNQAVVDFKLSELKKEFGGIPAIRESPYSIYTQNGYSNIFLWHLYQYLRVTKEITPRSVLEIGGGYGGLARIFKKLLGCSYTIIDLPESLRFSKAFLELNGIFDVCFVSAENPVLENKYDVVIAVGSFQEMLPETVKEYINLIQSLDVGYLYSCNYGKVRGRTREASFVGELPIDNKWEVVFRQMDNPIIRIDTARKRHFLEILLKRI